MGTLVLWIADKILALVWDVAVHLKGLAISKVPHEEWHATKPWIVITNNGRVPFAILKVGFIIDGRAIWLGEHIPWGKTGEETPCNLDPGTSKHFTLQAADYELWMKSPPACLLTSGKIVTGDKAIVQDQPRSAR